jgi:hypothetical protein
MEKYIEFIKECGKDYESKVKNNFSQITLADKMKKVEKKLEEVSMKKCPEQFERFNNLVEVSNINGKTQIAPKEGKNLEAQQAFNELRKCQGELSQIIPGIQGMINITQVLLVDQLDLCVLDCVKIENEDDAKKCIKGCFTNIYNYTLTANQKIMDRSLTTFEEQLNKNTI